MNLAVGKTTILSIIFMGVVIMSTGIILFIYRQHVVPYMRFLLPIPPIGVASYVFVYNLFSKYGGQPPATPWITFVEVCWASVISFAIFFVFSLILVFLVDFSR